MRQAADLIGQTREKAWDRCRYDGLISLSSGGALRWLEMAMAPGDQSHTAKVGVRAEETDDERPENRAGGHGSFLTRKTILPRA